jgi:hypothetical protein
MPIQGLSGLKRHIDNAAVRAVFTCELLAAKGMKGKFRNLAPIGEEIAIGCLRAHLA